MPNANTNREYRKLRGGEYPLPAQQAIREARTELLLQWAEREERVRFDWSHSQDFDPHGFYGFPEPEQTRLTNELIRNLESGSWEALELSCEILQPCGLWELVSSVSWIVVGVDDPYNYKRQCERDLFSETL